MIKNKRIYGIDLLRIISMYMIVILHVLGQGGILFNLKAFSIKYDVIWFIEILCYCSVNCYAMITGYVMCEKKIKYKKIFNLWFVVFFWSFFLTLILKFFYNDMIGLREIFKSMFPVIYGKYWYFSSYFCLFFFLPFINKFLLTLEKREFKRLIIILIILFSIITIVTDPFLINSGYSFAWLFSSYLIGYYIKKYGFFNNIKNKYLIFIFGFMVFLTLIFKLLNIKYSFIGRNLYNPDVFIKYNSFPILVASICLFLVFSKINIKNIYMIRFIKRMSPCTFGVYIIHTQTFVWNFIMFDLFKHTIGYNLFLIVLSVLFWAFMIYVFCSFVEMFRIYVFNKLKMYRIENFLYNNVNNFFKKIAEIDF